MRRQPEKTARTKQNMIDVFWKLAEEKGLDKVTASALAKEAGINRATFYAYFTDMDDLIFQAEEQILLDMRTKMADALLQQGLSADLSDAATKVVETLAQYDEKLFLLLGENGDSHFVSLFRQEASKLFSMVFSDKGIEMYKDYIVAYVTSAFLGVLNFWHESGRKISINEMAAICRKITVGGMKLLCD